MKQLRFPSIPFSFKIHITLLLLLCIPFTTLAQLIVPDANGIVFVKKNSTGNGSSWNNAVGEMADALKFAKEANAVTPGTVTEIWAAEGKYHPLYRPDNFAGPSHGNYNSFLMVRDVKLYGGFAGTETSITQRQILQHPTILDGANASSYAVRENLVDNEYYVYAPGASFFTDHVVIAAGDVGTAELNGFTVQGGDAGLGDYSLMVNGQAVVGVYGGGMAIVNSSPTISYCTFQYNAARLGGACSLLSSSSLISNNLFVNNVGGKSGNGGGGAALAVDDFPDGLLRNCTFVKNYSIGYSSVIIAGIRQPTLDSRPIQNCIIWGNDTLWSIFGEMPVTNCLIIDGAVDDQLNNWVYTNAANNDYTLPQNSLAVNEGTLLNYPNATTETDLAGNPRVAGSSIDIGAFEYQTPPLPCSLTTIWNGTSWSPFEPIADQAAVINGNYSSTSDLSVCSLTVNSGNVIVNSGHDFNVTGAVTVNGGSLTFENNANLIQVDDVSNTGAITVKRNASMRRLDYVYWGSPVAGQDIKAFSAQTVSPPVGTSRFYTLNETTNTFESIPNPNGVSFVEAKGYMIRAPNNFNPSANATPQTFEGVFTGVPHNGNATAGITTSGFGFNMLANPYPSPISANAFLAQNPGALYFWTHTNQNPGSGSNYATWTTFGSASSTTPVQSAVPNGTIQTGQGFLLLTPLAGTATFTNSMRVGNNDGQFFRNANEGKDRIWLNLSNTSGSQNQILIGYMDGATNGIDVSIDAKQIESGISNIASLIGNEKFNIQALAMPFSDTDEIPLSFNALTAGEYTISIDHADGLFAADQEVYIKDSGSGIVHNLTQSPYTFAAEPGTVTNRFNIVFQNVTLGIEEPLDATNIVVFKKDNLLRIDSGKTGMKTVKLFDIRGRLLYQRNNINATTTVLDNVVAMQGILLIQISTDNGDIVTKKIVK